MLPQKGIKYLCKISYNQYEKGKIYLCLRDGYLNVDGYNYRISDEVFFESYFRQFIGIGRTCKENKEAFSFINTFSDINRRKKEENKIIEIGLYNEQRELTQTLKASLLNSVNFGLTVEEVGQFQKNIANALSDKESNFTIEPLMTFSKNLTKDKIVLQVMSDLNNRSRVGIEKYNTTLERTDLELKDWLQHLLEELMDATLYLKRIQNEIENKQS